MGLVRYAILLVCLINSPPLCRQEVIKREAKTAKAARAGKGRPSFTLCDIHVGRQYAAGEAAGHAATSAKRLHVTRGHFKVRKTGIFWWNQHWRGDAKLGTVEKQYRALP